MVTQKIKHTEIRERDAQKRERDTLQLWGVGWGGKLKKKKARVIRVIFDRAGDDLYVVMM